MLKFTGKIFFTETKFNSGNTFFMNRHDFIHTTLRTVCKALYKALGIKNIQLIKWNTFTSHLNCMTGCAFMIVNRTEKV